jgi:hypothetical protein
LINALFDRLAIEGLVLLYNGLAAQLPPLLGLDPFIVKNIDLNSRSRFVLFVETLEFSGITSFHNSMVAVHVQNAIMADGNGAEFSLMANFNYKDLASEKRTFLIHSMNAHLPSI